MLSLLCCTGLIAARSAGAFAVAVLTTLPRERLEAEADLVVEGGLSEVLRLLERQRKTPQA